MRTRHRGLLLEKARKSDTDQTAIAANFQTTHPRWLVMWSRWHQTFTAFACFTRLPTIIDEAHADAFIKRIKQVELECSVDAARR